MKFDLAFGNSPSVREAFLDNQNNGSLIFDRHELMNFDYPNHLGDPEVVEITRQVIKRQNGKEYKYVYLVNGATGGCVIALRAYKKLGMINCITRNPPYYIRYPKMIESSGLKHILETSNENGVILLDVPSNPLGKFSSINSLNPVILDAVYLNNVYTTGKSNAVSIPHAVLVGSYSKLLGINGIRLGWIATNDDLLAQKIEELIISEYCGLSTASTMILKHSLEDYDWANFELQARVKLDYNREQWSTLERFFDYSPVSSVGMFYYAPMDKKAQQIFEKAGITWTKGTPMGTSDDFARFNLGQTNKIIYHAAQAVFKADRIK